MEISYEQQQQHPLKKIGICDVGKPQDDDDDQERKIETFDDGSRFNQELNLLDSLNMGNSSESTTQQASDTTDHQPRVFSCNYCQRKFYSSQALGGHQNAHKRERTLAKRSQRIGFLSNSPMISAAAAFGHTYLHQQHHHDQNYCSTLSSLPLHGYKNNNNNNNRSLGIQVHSMIHKPSSSMFSGSNNSGFKSFYGPKGWSSRPHVDQQPAIGKLNIASYPSSLAGAPPAQGGVVGRFEVVRSGISSMAMDEVVGLRWPELKTNQDESQKLDLSLKL